MIQLNNLSTKQHFELVDLTEQELIALQGGAIPVPNLIGAAIGAASGGAAAAITGANPGGVVSATLAGGIGGFVSPVSSLAAAKTAFALGVGAGMIGGTAGNLVDMYNNRKP